MGVSGLVNHGGKDRGREHERETAGSVSDTPREGFDALVVAKYLRCRRRGHGGHKERVPHAVDCHLRLIGRGVGTWTANRGAREGGGQGKRLSFRTPPQESGKRYRRD